MTPPARLTADDMRLLEWSPSRYWDTVRMDRCIRLNAEGPWEPGRRALVALEEQWEREDAVSPSEDAA